MSIRDVGASAAEQYGRILDDFAVIACDYPAEHDFGCVTFATRSLLACRPDDAYRNDRMDRWLDVFARDETRSSFRPRRGELGEEALRLASAAPVLLHEGYLHEPPDECSAEIEQLRAQLGDRFWAVSPTLWSAWGSKTSFRPRCAQILGEDSVPPGVEGVADGVGDVVTLLKHWMTETPGQVVVKLPGSAGFANAIIEPGKDDPDLAVRSLWAENVRHDRPVDVVIESWLPWESTHSLSYFLGRDQSPAVVATCEQVVDGDGVFAGSRSHLSLGDADADAVMLQVRRLIDAMAQDGYVGVAAIDVIVGRFDAWDGLGLPLPSGRRMIVIECNPRFNYHNKIGLIVERFARAWGIPSPDLQWQAANVEAGHHRTIAALLDTRPQDAEIAIPPPPEPGRPSLRLFAHRTEKAVELTVTLRPT